jgi:O-antigen ligase
VALALFVLLLWRLGFQSVSLKIRMSLSGILIGALVGAWVFDVLPGKDRLIETIQSTQAFEQGDFQHAEVRWSIWYAAWEAWKQAPVLGVGTGGFPEAAHRIKQQHPALQYEGTDYPAHPHNMYLMDLVRWGPAGLLLILLLFWFWFHADRNRGWQYRHGCLVNVSALALCIHGLTAPSLEEYYGSVYAAIYLAVGLAALEAGSAREILKGYDNESA